MGGVRWGGWIIPPVPSHAQVSYRVHVYGVCREVNKLGVVKHGPCKYMYVTYCWDPAARSPNGLLLTFLTAL